MLYLCFADTSTGEYSKVVHGKDDNDAVYRMATWLLEGLNIKYRDTYLIACVWEKDPLFYTARCCMDLEEEEY